MTIREIRSSFLEYFESKDHKIVESANLVPVDDPTLLFTTAGMVPFKDYFSGTRKPPANRLASVQKCFRTSDLEEVGKTKRHLSFFEMLGNFSFGDYFKKEAIEFGWEFSSAFLPFKKEDIWITIFLDDDEAYEIWNKHIGIPKDKIVRLDRKDNFWGPAGSTGACGPCSELYLDRGKDYNCISDDCLPGDEGERFMEYWNLVFNEFNLNSDGVYLPLKNTGIDTGAGLERLATLVQGVDSVFDTDELSKLIKNVESIFSVEYKGDNITPIRVLVDHGRALAFTMADGILPSNESRGYVLRRLLRRALLFGRKIGQKEPLLTKLIPEITNIYGYFYPELKKSTQQTVSYIESEEKRFLQTLDDGYDKLNELLQRAADGAYGGNKISGKEVFNLYDTFGFPPELTKEVADTEGLSVNMQEFEAEMDKQRARGKAAWRRSSADVLLQTTEPTKFIGYDSKEGSSKVVELHYKNKITTSISESGETNDGKDNQNADENNDGSDNDFIVVTKHTPCYAEGGGQVGDIGTMRGENFSCTITDTQKNGDIFYHVCTSLHGKIETNAAIDIQIDSERRSKLEKNHSATHLLNSVLRKQFGEHIKQSGSLVAPNYLRFDFTHPEKISDEIINTIEQQTNEAINRNFTINIEEMNIDQARKSGAVMTFGEKYGDVVRVVNMDAFSVELCAGTHVEHSSDINLFIITKESSPGAGNRRIEALTYNAATDHINNEYKALLNELTLNKRESSKAYQEQLNNLITELENNKNANNIDQWISIKKIKNQLQELQRAIKKEMKKSHSVVTVDESIIDDIIKTKSKINSVNYSFATIDGNIPHLKNIADLVRGKEPSLVVLLCGSDNGKWNFVMATTKNYAEENKLDMTIALKKTLKEIPELKGGGGGKKELSQASGVLPVEFTSYSDLLFEKAKLFLAEKIFIQP